MKNLHYKFLFILFSMSFVLFFDCKSRGNEPNNTNTNETNKKTEYVANGVKFVMVSIDKANKVVLGNNTDEQNKEHTVSLSPYTIGETEVTQELWQAVMKNNPSNFDGSEKKKAEEGEIQVKRPVEKVSWFMAIAFCNELTKVVGIENAECVYYSDVTMTKIYVASDANNKLTPFMDMTKKGFRLPTEAEWEWAAMGGEKTKYAGTNEKQSLQDYAWISINSKNKTHEVKKKKPNGYGLYDMSGNVWEWCWDWHSDPIDTSNEENPLGVPSGLTKVWKGASYSEDNELDEDACYFRASNVPDFAGRNIGIRLVRR